MDVFRYTLRNNRPKRYNSHWKIFIVLGIINFLSGLFFLIFKKPSSMFGFLYLFEGVGFILYGLFRKRSMDKFFIQIDKNGVSASYKKLNVKWTNISKAHIARMYINLFVNDGSQLILPLDNLGFNDVRLLKSKFQEFANEAKINIS